MLGKTKKPENSTSMTVPPKKVEKPRPPAPKPAPTPSEEKTTIGKHISIEGQIKGEEHLIIEGVLKGNVEMEKHNFMVGTSGRVDGEIKAQNVSISGQLEGRITALGRVQVTKEADFFGDIKAKSISVEDGAYFKGSIELSREPHRKGSSAVGARGPAGSGTPKTGSLPAASSRKES